MNDLDPELRKLVEGSRGADDPPAGARDRVAGKLAVGFGIEVLAASTAMTVPAAAPAAASAAAPVAAGTAPLAPAAVGAGLGAGAKVVGVLAVVAAGTLAVPQARHVIVSAVSHRPEAVRVAPAPSTSPLESELALLRSAQRALRDGRGPAALAALDEHQRRFPGGVLRPERRAARVQALCLLGRVSLAREEAAAFLAETPASPLARQVEESCARAPGRRRQ